LLQPDVLRVFQTKGAYRDPDGRDYVIELKTPTLSIVFALYAPWNAFDAFEAHVMQSMRSSTQQRSDFSIGAPHAAYWVRLNFVPMTEVSLPGTVQFFEGRDEAGQTRQLDPKSFTGADIIALDIALDYPSRGLFRFRQIVYVALDTRMHLLADLHALPSRTDTGYSYS
jgi:hypothetical protein